jgi:cytochrome oxidase Cu insertion factor (SCO1/SenC/PrrC family)
VYQNPKEQNRPPRVSFEIDPDNDQIVYMREYSELYSINNSEPFTVATGYTVEDKIAIKAGVETAEVLRKDAQANQFNQGGNRNVTNTRAQD